MVLFFWWPTHTQVRSCQKNLNLNHNKKRIENKFRFLIKIDDDKFNFKLNNYL